jgi:hypothetical protein
MSNWLTLVRVGTYNDGSAMVINQRTAGMLRRVEDRLGYELTITQGGHHEGGVSGGTHLHMAVDLAPFDWGRKVRALRLEGFAAWHRVAIPGTWPEHIHAVPIGDPENASGTPAWYQVRAYYNDCNGLGSSWCSAPDDGPRFNPIPTTPLTLEDFVSITDWSVADRQKLRDIISGEVKSAVTALIPTIIDAVWHTDGMVESAAYLADHPTNTNGIAGGTAAATTIDRLDRIENAGKALAAAVDALASPKA